MEKEEEEEAGREPPVWGGEDMVKIVKNTAAVSSILSSTISVLVAAVPPLSILRRTPIKETKVTSGGSGVGGRPPLFSASAYMRHIRGEFLPEEREKGIYIYIYTRVLCIDLLQGRFLFEPSFASPFNSEILETAF